MTTFEFTQLIEEILEKEVLRLLPGYWDEDQLTNNFLIELSKIKTVKITDLNGLSKVRINAFKQSGALTESKFGDIAVLIKINYPDGEVIEGVGYLEAKKRTFGSMNFNAANDAQLKRINSNAPRARLLLYDYNPISGFIPTYCEEPYFENSFERVLRYLPVTHSVALPINVAIELNKVDTSLYKFGIPFSQQLVFRYLYAHDLEFEKESIDASKGFAKKYRLSSYILTVEVSPANDQDFSGIQVNNDFYKILE